MNKIDHLINDYNRFIKSSIKFINQIKKKTEDTLNNIMILNDTSGKEKNMTLAGLRAPPRATPTAGTLNYLNFILNYHRLDNKIFKTMVKSLY